MGSSTYTETSRANKRDYYLKNREAILADRRARYALDPKRYMGRVSTPAQAERQNERSKKWRLENPAQYKAAKQARYAKTRDRAWERNLRNKYGISVSEYSRLFSSQGGRCAICESAGRRRLAVDHDHQTGRVRGLLCDKCNKAIGLFSDSVDRLNKVIIYLTSGGN